MRICAVSLCVLAIAAAAVGAEPTGLRYDYRGGSELTVRVIDAEAQQWLVLPDRQILIAAILQGRLVVEIFSWPAPGPTPEPDPQPKPPEPQPVSRKWQIMAVVESGQLDNLTSAQRAMLFSLLYRRELEKAGHRVVGLLDPESAGTATDARWRAWHTATRGRAPCIAIAPLDGGTIRVYPLPPDWDGLLRLLANPPVTCPDGKCEPK